MIIEGDSHARGLATLIQDQVAGSLRVYGVCKPGAKLADVLSGAAPPAQSCCVILAGTNDIDEGEHYNIFQQLEPKIKDRLSSSQVILCTLPHRHDLPAGHPVHQQIVTTNFYMEELCARYNGLHLLDINVIRRHLFTKWGMHLRRPGRRLLARLMLRLLVD